MIPGPGLTGPSTTEVLSVNQDSWSYGPTLPVYLFSVQVVEDPRGGIVTVGNLNGALQMYYLRDAGPTTTWVLLPQKMQVSTYQLVAFTIPDE